MFRNRILAVALWLPALQGALAAQMPGMTMSPSASDGFIANLLRHDGSGTSAEPDSTSMPMWMGDWGGWGVMLHGEGFFMDQQQSGPRGYDKAFSTNWAHAQMSRQWGASVFTLRTMLSLEPLTVTDRRYPELLQTGETAYGQPIVDGQHPHNFFMELAAIYDLKLGQRSLFSVYAAPMGDPAIGPTAYPHRASADENPIAPLAHHLEDSTHVAADVVTIGATHGPARLEASAFHGREPDENRWAIQYGGLDSYSWRVTVNPATDWSGQVSWAHIHSPEALNPFEDQIRMTGSVMVDHPLARGDWATSFIWGRTRNVGGGNVLNGYTAESRWSFSDRNHVWTRLENVDKSTDLLLGDNPPPSNFVERFYGRVQAYSLGYDRDVVSADRLQFAAGAQWTLDRVPAGLAAVYGPHPQGVAVFLRGRLGGN